jgi:PAS domain S-box-containing protein
MAVLNHDGELVGIINSRDITDRIEVENRLRRSEEQYRSFFEDDLSGAYITTPEGTILECNPAFVRMFGFSSREEATKANASALYKNPEDRKQILRLLTEEKKIEYQSLELIRQDGTALYAVGNIAGTFDESGRLTSMKGYLFDETKRRQLEGELVQAQKMESLGRLAGGIAHDFNNLLAIILGQAGLLERQSSDPERVRKGAETIGKASHRGADLVKQLLTFARSRELHLVGEGTCGLYSRDLPEDHRHRPAAQREPAQGFR